jgi:DNA-binding CsgD family transcriptional regulator
MSQSLVALFDVRGTFLDVSNLSRGAELAGMDNASVIGKKIWDFAPPHAVAPIKQAFAECLFSGTPQTYDTVSEINGVREHWRTVIFASRGSEVVAFSQEMHTPTSIMLSHDDMSLLRDLADDMTVDEIAARDGHSASTMSSRLKRLRDKCGVKTTHGLVSWSYRYAVFPALNL